MKRCLRDTQRLVVIGTEYDTDDIGTVRKCRDVKPRTIMTRDLLAIDVDVGVPFSWDVALARILWSETKVCRLDVKVPSGYGVGRDGYVERWRIRSFR